MKRKPLTKLKKRRTRKKIYLTSSEAVRTLISSTINEVRDDRMGSTKARTLGYLSNIALKALEQSELVKKFEDLEARIGKIEGKSA